VGDNNAGRFPTQVNNYNLQKYVNVFLIFLQVLYFFTARILSPYPLHFSKDGEGDREGLGTPTKRQVSKRQVSKRLVSKSPVSKRQVYKTSGLQNVRFQNVWFQNVQFLKSIYLINKKYRNCQVSMPI
jgi:hypothetical protein